MSCATCGMIVCKDLYISPCDAGVNTGINLPVTDTYLFQIGFNGSAQQFSLEVTGGQNIVLPNVLNSDYVHELRIYDASGDLAGDTCYKLNTHTVIGPGNNLNPNPFSGNKKFITVTVDGNMLTDAFFALNTITEMATDSQDYIRNVGFTQNGATITATSFGFYIGQIILAKA